MQCFPSLIGGKSEKNLKRVITDKTYQYGIINMHATDVEIQLVQSLFVFLLKYISNVHFEQLSIVN